VILQKILPVSLITIPAIMIGNVMTNVQRIVWGIQYCSIIVSVVMSGQYVLSFHLRFLICVAVGAASNLLTAVRILIVILLILVVVVIGRREVVEAGHVLLTRDSIQEVVIIPLIISARIITVITVVVLRVNV